jgi:hypothetical protein
MLFDEMTAVDATDVILKNGRSMEPEASLAVTPTV